MDHARRFQLSNVLLFAVALAHALSTWPPGATVALFAGGAALAFALEAVGIAAGLLRHEARPRVAGVPVSVPLAWPAIVYVAYRVALLVVPAGVPAAALAALLATAADAATDPAMVRRGLWSYPPSRLSTPRFRGVPWWNFLAWPGLVFVTAMLPALVG
jgi:putative membrane protein